MLSIILTLVIGFLLLIIKNQRMDQKEEEEKLEPHDMSDYIGRYPVLSNTKCKCASYVTLLTIDGLQPYWIDKGAEFTKVNTQEKDVILQDPRGIQFRVPIKDYEKNFEEVVE